MLRSEEILEDDDVIIQFLTGPHLCDHRSVMRGEARPRAATHSPQSDQWPQTGSGSGQGCSGVVCAPGNYLALMSVALKTRIT